MFELRWLTDLAARRGHGVDLPTLRGVLTTDDGAVGVGGRAQGRMYACEATVT